MRKNRRLRVKSRLLSMRLAGLENASAKILWAGADRLGRSGDSAHPRDEVAIAGYESSRGRRLSLRDSPYPIGFVESTRLVTIEYVTIEMTRLIRDK